MPTIETTLGACLDAEASLAQLAALPCQVKTAYHIAKLLRLMRTETKAFEEHRVTVVKALGAARAPTDAEKARGLVDDVIEVGQDRMQEYVAQYTELRAAAITIAWAPLTLAELDGQSVTAALLYDLGPFLID